MAPIVQFRRRAATRRQVVHSSNKSPWQRRELPLGVDRILVFCADGSQLKEKAFNSPAKTRCLTKSWHDGRKSYSHLD
jgi:hypothetical protein